jgi:hypothetical protein
MYNNSHFDVKLETEFFDAKFIICVTFPVKPAHDTEIKERICEDADNESAYIESYLFLNFAPYMYACD